MQLRQHLPYDRHGDAGDQQFLCDLLQVYRRYSGIACMSGNGFGARLLTQQRYDSRRIEDDRRHD